MKILKRLITLLPGGSELAARHSYQRRSRKLDAIGDTEARFTHIYDHNHWKSEESLSGVGSTLEATDKLRAELPLIVEKYGIKRILDAPCGDFNWMRAVNWIRDIHYIGGDIVQSLIDLNQKKFGDSTTSFVHLDLISEPLPAADILICRDCLIHFSLGDIDRSIRNFLSSKIPYLLTSTYVDVSENIDIPTGHCRFINLERAPFDFPEPLKIIVDYADDAPGKRLALWSRDQLTEFQDSSFT